MSGQSSSLTGGVAVTADDAVVTLAGALAAGGSPLLTALLAAATAAGGAVTVDLAGVDDLEPAGVTALQQAAALLQAEGRQLTVLGARSPVDVLLRAAGLLDAPSPSRSALMSPELRTGLVARAGAGSAQQLLDAALVLVVSMAQTVIEQADGVSITLLRDGAYRTVAASNDVVLAMDHDQYDTGEGPCLDAAREGEALHVDSLSRERRWTQFIPRARARGIESILSVPLHDAHAPHGALNLYTSTAGAFARREERWARAFATQASAVLTFAHEALPTEQQHEQLEQALGSRTAIARAQGWVMQRDGVDADTAWSTLTETSRTTSLPLRDVCEDLLHPGDGGVGGRGAGSHER